jgi:hypothetical protein
VKVTGQATVNVDDVNDVTFANNGNDVGRREANGARFATATVVGTVTDTRPIE